MADPIRIGRIIWTLVSLAIVQTLVCAIAAAPAVLIAIELLRYSSENLLARVALISLPIVPLYMLFALCLMIVSPLAMRMFGWETPDNVATPLANLDWPLLRWVRYGASIHLVRIVAGSVFRGTPLWTMHLRLGGARLGKRVYVNSLSVSDYNLIECGDDVVIGGGVHLSGHTVENGLLKTARVRLGNGVTIGLESVIEIGVDIGAGAQVGALSFVPKYATLAGGRVYAGTPAMPIDDALLGDRRG